MYQKSYRSLIGLYFLGFNVLCAEGHTADWPYRGATKNGGFVGDGLGHFSGQDILARNRWEREARRRGVKIGKVPLMARRFTPMVEKEAQTTEEEKLQTTDGAVPVSPPAPSPVVPHVPPFGGYGRAMGPGFYGPTLTPPQLPQVPIGASPRTVAGQRRGRPPVSPASPPPPPRLAPLDPPAAVTSPPLGVRKRGPVPSGSRTPIDPQRHR